MNGKRNVMHITIYVRKIHFTKIYKNAIHLRKSIISKYKNKFDAHIYSDSMIFIRE
jgi:hypothetical protein